MHYTKKQIFAMITAMRDQGWAVCAWTPRELRGMNPTRVEDRMCEEASDLIENCAEEKLGPEEEEADALTVEEEDTE